MEVYVHLLSDVWPVQLCVDLAAFDPRTTSYLEDSSSHRLAEVLIVETLKLRLTPSGLVVTDDRDMCTIPLAFTDINSPPPFVHLQMQTQMLTIRSCM